ncbi:MAG TPA: leucyl aminopeptidase [Longilinea sp.]|nr:leucyl aminopeptidase [Longilinea sp.]
MDTSSVNPTVTMKLELNSEPLGPKDLHVVFKPAPEKPTFGDPGAQAGDTFLADPWMVLVSLGKAAKLSPEAFRQAGGGLAKWIRENHIIRVHLDVASLNGLGVAGSLPALLEGLLLGSFRFDRYKESDDELEICVMDLHSEQVGALEKTVQRCQKICAAVNLSRDWSHEPANIINPLTLADRAIAIARQFHLRCTILDEKQLNSIGAGAIVAVGKGSATPSRLIILEYPGNNPPAGAKPVVLVGKALTFDTGGYSIKDTTNIQTMKYDKCGGLTVIATLCAVAELKLETPVVGVIGVAENMISGEAYRPDDIIRSLSGKTIEIISTDAEGRLVLADSLTYAQQKFQPRAIIDLATLTGGVVVALGRNRAGLMSNDDQLSQQLFTAGEQTSEKLWRLPLDDEYFKLIKGDDADIKNSGGREGHAILGGMFLKQFISDGNAWAHLDIAGMADSPKDLPYCPKGGTGFGVRLLIQYLENLD